MIKKTGYNPTKNHYVNTVSEEAVVPAIEFLFECLRITKGIGEVNQRLKIWYDVYPDQFNAVMLRYLEANPTFNVHPLKPIISTFVDLIGEELQILNLTLAAKEGKYHFFSPKEQNEILERIIDKYINNKNIEDILSTFLSDESTRIEIVSILSALEINKIMSLPQSLMELTLDKLTSPETIQQMSSNYTMLHFIATSGSLDHQESILQTLKVNINKLEEEVLNQTLEVINSICKISPQESNDLLFQISQGGVGKKADKELLKKAKLHLKKIIKGAEK